MSTWIKDNPEWVVVLFLVGICLLIVGLILRKWRELQQVTRSRESLFQQLLKYYEQHRH